jgi:hypothetical protein
VFCEGDSASITLFVSKWRPFSFIYNRGSRNVGWVGDASHVIFGQKFPGEKESVGRCVDMMQQSVLLLAKLRAKPYHIFAQSP